MKTVSDLVQLKEGDMPVTAMDIGGARYIGLTKREYFAGLAMQGLLANGDYTGVESAAVVKADALLKELEK